MIDKTKAQALGVKTTDTSDIQKERTQQKIEEIKSILPHIVNADNQFDVKALQDLLDVSQTTSNNQGYELTFAGKGIARAQADTPTDKELKIETTQSKNVDNTDNVVIRGDNLDVLKILYKNYHKKIKGLAWIS